MSVSTRSTKAAMYSEIERLRLELDRARQQLAGCEQLLFEERAMHGTTREELRSQREAPKPSAPPISDRRALMEFSKNYSLGHSVLTRIVDGNVEARINGTWVVVS